MQRWSGMVGMAGFLCGLSGLVAQADYPAPRQYYGPWQSAPQQNYYYRSYYYKPKADYSGYKHHQVIYSPASPKYEYFYNPYKKQYWGRCPSQRDGQSLYSLLPPETRQPRLQDIPESAFPAPRAAPPIPESTDGAQMDLPPDDFPNAPPAPRSN